MARLVMIVLLSGIVSVTGLSPQVWAHDPSPVCRVPTVLDVMRRDLRQRDQYARIEPRLIEEYPTPTPNVVLCRVTAISLRYDSYRAPRGPVRYRMLYEFRVRTMPSGYVLSFGR